MTPPVTPSATQAPAIQRQSSRRRDFRTTVLYLHAILWEFRYTLLMLIAVVVIGTLVFSLSPIDVNNQRPTFGRALYASWMAMLAQQFFTPGPWYVAVINSIFPPLGLILVGEGIVRLGLLMVSRRRGEKEWMNVMASTYRNHVILTGLGHLGYRIFQQLRAANVDVVGLDIDEDGPFISEIKKTGSPVLIRDMREDQSLIDAGIEHAQAIVIATNADMANIEVALDARRMNPKIRVIMRLFEQRIAEKIADAIHVDAAFSASALAAPMVAAMSLNTNVISTVMIGKVPHVISELRIAEKSVLAQQRVDELEKGYSTRVLGRVADTPQEISQATIVEAGDRLIFHTPASQLARLTAAANDAR